MFLTRDAILSAQDLPTQEVDVPEWGGKVLIRALTGEQRDLYEASIYEIKGKDLKENMKNVRAKLVAVSVIDEDGNPMFSLADVEVLGRKSAKALDRVYEAAQALNKFRAEDLEELVGN